MLKRGKRTRLARVSLVTLLAQIACVPVVRAQAWVQPKGEGTLSLTYQHYDVAGHYDAFGNKANDASTRSEALVTDIDYGITDTVGLAVSLPFIASKYTGPPVFLAAGHLTHAGPLDDGSYHAAVQDVRIELRKLFWTGPVAIAPFGGFSFPTHDYETVGEAVPGRHRRDVQVGASAGTDLDRIIPNAYVHVRYAFGRAQVIDNHPFTRSNIDVEGGHATTTRLTLRGLINWQIRHQGPAIADLLSDWEHHDRFIAPSYLNLGGGASFTLARSAEIYALWAVTVKGSNGAHRGRLIAAGTTWSFGRGLHGLGADRASRSAGLQACRTAGGQP